MREARVVLPVKAGDLAHRWLGKRLLADFGGYTRTAACGAWVDDKGDEQTEENYCYDVAMSDEPTSDWALLAIVDNLFQRTDEQAIYVRGRDGSVSIIDRPRSGEVMVA